MTEAGLVLNALLNFLPGSFLRIWPFWDRLSVKKTTVIIYYLFFFTAQSAVLVWLHGQHEMNFRDIQFFKLSFGAVGFFLPFVFIRVNIFKTLFFYFIVAVYQTAIIRTAKHIDVRYFGSGLDSSAMFANNLTLIMLSVLTLPIMALFIKRIIMPIINSKYYPDIWRFFWLVPAAFFALPVADSLGLGVSLSYMASNWFLLINLFVIGGIFAVFNVMSKMLKEATEKAALQEHAHMMENQLVMQKEHYKQLMRESETVKAMRHDLRHHMVIFRQFAESGDSGKMKKYINDLNEELGVTRDKAYCENHEVGVITAHYLGIAESEGISVEALLDIPEGTGRVPAMDLCVIMGNFLENAVEACRRVTRGEKFIRARSRIDGDRLSIVVDNSFDGIWREEGGVYISRKEAPETRGVGLPSVIAVCEKHRGLVQFDINEETWKSSALVHMK